MGEAREEANRTEARIGVSARMVPALGVGSPSISCLLAGLGIGRPRQTGPGGVSELAARGWTWRETKKYAYVCLYEEHGVRPLHVLSVRRRIAHSGGRSQPRTWVSRRSSPIIPVKSSGSLRNTHGKLDPWNLLKTAALFAA